MKNIFPKIVLGMAILVLIDVIIMFTINASSKSLFAKIFLFGYPVAFITLIIGFANGSIKRLLG